MKTPVILASVGAVALLSLFSVSAVFAQTPARPDKILTIAELRGCMKLEQANKLTAAEILQTQEAFKRDQDAVKTEQGEVSQTTDILRARSATLISERDTLSALATVLSSRAQAAKTDAEKADVEAERTRLLARNRQYEQDIASFNTAQDAMSQRVTALNVRIDPINQRSKTINDRVEPHQKQIATWRDQCGNRRFREEDEVVIKKELAAGK